MLHVALKLLGPDSIRLSIGGSLDGTTALELEPTLDRLVERQPWRVVLEMSRLRIIDSIGVGALVRFAKRLRISGGLVDVGGLCEQPLVVFRLLGLDRHLGFAPDTPCS